MSANRSLVDSIEQCSGFIEKFKEECTVPDDKFSGSTASILECLQRAELDKIYDIYNKLLTLL